MAQVTSITIDPGAGPVHVTVTDQAGNPIPPADIVWSGAPAGVTMSADSTGFNFEASAGTSNTQSTEMTATYTPNNVFAQLAVTVQLTVVSLQFESP